MIVHAPVDGFIHVNADNYPTHPDAWKRPAGNHEPAVTHDFGPTNVAREPHIVWPGGEANIFGVPIPKGDYPLFHVGIDIGNAGTGYNVRAMAPGTVTTSGRNGVGAEVIVIDHGMVDGHRYATRYVHLSTRLVGVGKVVALDQLIGKTGSTGISTGPHLHAAMEKDGKPVDLWRRLAQNTSVDPDAPPQEADVPVLTSYIPGHIATISNATGDVNVRDAPVSGKVLRQIPKGSAETWTVTGWCKGDVAAGSDQWLTRWNGGWEFCHSINVASISAPPTPKPTKLAPGLYQV